MSGQRVEAMNPRRCGFQPYLPLWREFLTLADAPPPDTPLTGRIVSAGIENRRAAIAAEMLDTVVAAIGCLCERLRRTLRQPDRRRRRQNRDALRRTCESLAILAMTDRNLRGVDVGFVSNLSAITVAVDFHCSLP
jgi:hypothetical protein